MFVQLIDFTCQDQEQLLELADEWTRDVVEEGTVRRAVLGRQSGADGRYVWMVEFESADEARRNSERPETEGYSQRLRAMCSEGPTFVDLDIVY